MNKKSNTPVKPLPGTPVDVRVWSNALPLWDKAKEWGAMSKSLSKK